MMHSWQSFHHVFGYNKSPNDDSPVSFAGCSRCKLLYLFLLNSKVYYCVHKNLLSLELIKPLNSTCTLARCVGILIYLFIYLFNTECPATCGIWL